MAKASIWIGGVAVVALVAGAGYYLSTQQQTTGPVASSVSVPKLREAPLMTPQGITIQAIQGINPYFSAYGGQAKNAVLADAKGMTLYTYDKDTEPGKSACVGDCIKAWPAAVAPANAKPQGDWTIITRDDGSKQWAFRGKPLYSFAKDTDIGSVGGNPPPALPGGGGAAAAMNAGAPKNEPIPAGWHTAAYRPAEGLTLPYGIGVTENCVANAQVFVDNRGLTLYASSNDVKNDKSDKWTPLAAAQLANPVGDWTLISRDDGIKQWAYQGNPVYTYNADYKPGDANGVGVDNQHQVAALASFFMPSNVKVAHQISRGPLLATAEGLTLYRRDSHIFRSGGHSLGASLPYRPPVGRSIGTKGCDAECMKTWHPFAAPADAQPSGYWSVMTREDGSKQWAYQGFALYTYAGDKKPGENNGNDIFDILVNDGVHQVASAQVGPAQTDAFALFWHNAEP